MVLKIMSNIFLSDISGQTPIREHSVGHASESDLKPLDKLFLVPDAIGFSLVFCWCAIEILRHQRLLRRDSESELTTSSEGWEMRRWFHIMLSISIFARLTAIVVELGLPAYSIEDTTSIACWGLSLAHGIADLLFLSTFSLLISFFAQLYYTTFGRSYSILTPCFYGSNLLLYLSFGSVAVITLLTRTFTTLRIFTVSLLGAAYGFALVSMLYFGIRVSIQLTPRAESSFPDGEMILTRVIFLCLLSSFMLFLRFLHCIVSVSVWHRHKQGYVYGMNRYVFDAIAYLILDLLPAALVMYLTAKKSSETTDGDGQQMYNNHFSSDGNNYFPVRLSPSRENGQDSLSSPLLGSNSSILERLR